jgi:hypothetical protein
VPIVRTFAPFVAGAGAMSYRSSSPSTSSGAIAWVTSMMGAGVFFGGLEIVQKHFEKVVILIVLVSPCCRWRSSSGRLAAKPNKRSSPPPRRLGPPRAPSSRPPGVEKLLQRHFAPARKPSVSLGSSERINQHIHLACAFLEESSGAFGGIF